ncbi:MAG: hypothetical protein HOM34_10240 [Planctomycetes bacterium]|jgi:hypothetical protein|nr:hypothetical protein [Planctomycetota bacterium]MBT4028129.1 hypothetical protein [Planctomycetota bacterium]MBT4560746.1 hypothetical protein [Planctomycetota bacterium]MBT5101246.1 hypothetical protein [Planctomycetota bacterium]MBT5121089.1 hypothetical protein [Planctomycetota bacterium]
MNFDAFWQTHRRFLTGIMGGVVVFFVAEMILGATIQSEWAASQQKIRASSSQLAKQRYGASQVAELRQRSTDLEAWSQSLAQQALPPLRARFAVPASASPAQHYIQETGRLRNELRSWALRQNCEVDESLGLPNVSPTQPAMIARILRGLDVVERVVQLGVLSGAQSIENISIGSRARRSKSKKGGSLLDTIPISIEVVFEPGLATGFLRAILAESGESADGPLGLVGLEVQEIRSKKKERRVILSFAAGELPLEEGGQS